MHKRAQHASQFTFFTPHYVSLSILKPYFSLFYFNDCTVINHSPFGGHLVCLPFSLPQVTLAGTWLCACLSTRVWAFLQNIQLEVGLLVAGCACLQPY